LNRKGETLVNILHKANYPLSPPLAAQCLIRWWDSRGAEIVKQSQTPEVVSILCAGLRGYQAHQVLGLLAEFNPRPEVREAVMGLLMTKKLDESRHIRKELKGSSDWARDIARQWESSHLPTLGAMGDEEMVSTLKALCRAYKASAAADVDRFEPVAEVIGEQLNLRGGMSEMRRIFNQLGDVPGVRTLEMFWNGIGDWRG
jgi:hypothetical protein